MMEEFSQGTCSPFVSDTTAIRTCLKTCSIVSPFCCITLTRFFVYGLLPPVPSIASFPGADANAISVPFAASKVAKPLAPDRPSPVKGDLQASSITIFLRSTKNSYFAN